MSEDINQILGIDGAGEPKPHGCTKLRMPKTYLLLTCICAGVAFYYLFKGADSAYSFSGGGKIASSRNVSAFTYYILWSSDRREAVESREAFGNSLFYNNPYVKAPKTRVATLPETMANNISMTVFFGIVAIGAYLFGLLASPPPPNRNSSATPPANQESATSDKGQSPPAQEQKSDGAT